MRLCFIADGRSIHTQRWAAHFGGEHEVHLVTYDPVGRAIPGVTEHVVPSPFRNLWLGFWPRHLRIRRLIREMDPDLVHAHFITKYGFHLPLGEKWPTVVSAWGDDILILPPKSRVIRCFTRRVLERADLVYAVSQDLMRHITVDFGIPAEKVVYLPIGIDTALFSPGAREGEGDLAKPVTLFSNRGFFPVYDTRTILGGFARALAKRPGLSLVLKGEGPEKEEMKALAAGMGLAGAVTFRDRSPYGEVPGDLRGSDIFVSAATSDGTPVSLLEAMATGLPCIATRVGGVPEWIEDGVNGLLVPPKDPAALCRAILALAGDPDLRARLGARARETVRDRADWGRLMARVGEDYERLKDRVRLTGQAGGSR